MEVKKGTYGVPGSEWREKEAAEEERWKRKARRVENTE